MNEIKSKYQQRPIRFLECFHVDEWKVKIYSISVRQSLVSELFISLAKKNLKNWLMLSKNTPLDNYHMAKLILHEGKEGCFAIVNWWIDENMLQQFVYLATHEHQDSFVLYSNSGIITCVWELAVIWFERNAWVEHVLSYPEQPNWQRYLTETLNADI